MMETKACRQCGEIKPLAQFRQYYGGRTGRYTICKSCEKINSRAKYLEKKRDLTEAERVELEKIYRLYDAQRACGLRPPKRQEGYKSTIDLDDMLSKYEAKANITEENLPHFEPGKTPIELLDWLSVELIEDPDYYLEEVYEDLLAKYRPILRIDQDTMMPVYEDTYATVLDKILERFNDYEDEFYNKEVL